ncbi:MAG: hypothetical protein ACRCX8_17980, partial [Sarcina sp.]
MGKILLKKQINLILKSTICDKDLILRDVLLEFSNGIETTDLEKIKSINEDIFFKLNSNEIIKHIIEDSSKEWIQEKPIGIKDIPCELCKNSNSKDKFIIRNRLNENILLVGTSCIEKFGGMKREVAGEKLRDLIKLTDKSGSEKYDRLKEFNKMYNGGKEIIDGWDYFYDSFKIIFPMEIELRWDKLNKGAK